MSALLLNWISIMVHEDFGASSIPRRFAMLDQLPYSLRGVRETFGGPGVQGWMFWVFLGAIFLLFAAVIIWNWWRSRKIVVARMVNDPQRLFTSLLKELDLPSSDKKLLRRMAAQARLRHPSQCLLSPDLLDWTRSLWRDAKGPNVVTPDISRRIDAIAVQLYDHLPPSPEEQPAAKTSMQTV